MATELVNTATSDKLSEVDWAKFIEICELVANDQRFGRVSGSLLALVDSMNNE